MLKVFLVEDEIVMREGIKKKIEWEKEGFVFSGDAGDGELAYPQILQKKPDILITDIRMPFMDGLELSRLVKKELPDIRIILLSGYDEFEYAKEAINIGIAEYLLKPVTSSQLVGTLKKVKQAIEEEQRRKEPGGAGDLSEERQIMHERQKLFRRLTSGRLSVSEMLNEGRKIGVELAAPEYNILMLQLFPAQEDETEQLSGTRDALAAYAKGHSGVLLVEMGWDQYACLIRGTEQAPVECIVQDIQQMLDGCQEAEYYGSLGRRALRLSDLKRCFEEANREFANRFLQKHQHISIYRENASAWHFPQEEENLNLSNLSGSKHDWKKLEGFLYTGDRADIPTFVEEYTEKIGHANLRSRIFCQYFLLDVYIIGLSVLEKIGGGNELLESRCGDIRQMQTALLSLEDTKAYFSGVLEAVIDFREKKKDDKYEAVLRRAQDYIGEHYASDDISLNQVAQEAGMSPNHFSAVFSQEMGKTFVEYLTNVRMEKAKQLLRTSSMKAIEVSFAVGYRDPHYFSTLFKKTQGCTPIEYRGGRKKT